ncbi:hypothetical protein ACFSKU_03655 [Pontibacter silvestris]|uniref:STAS/SEC14 domain-containing protein n=1 Tax=Pontibacter silvestris TaxID=2305183 RepID=A0ABW4WT82_9BACT|nr:hypothetical protein [Pontibacter silvestris]MCC9138043.1 hypothetical protein [Pontibacter silvestris]
MVLFDNSLIRLDYTPATDILAVEYPDLHDFLLSDIKRSIDTLVDTAKHYDVKRVLLDSTRTVSSVSEEASRKIAAYLAAGLMGTRVVKVARVQSPSATVETTAQENMKHVRQSLPLPFELQNFTCRAEAVEWLMARPN